MSRKGRGNRWKSDAEDLRLMLAKQVTRNELIESFRNLAPETKLEMLIRLSEITAHGNPGSAGVSL